MDDPVTALLDSLTAAGFTLASLGDTQLLVTPSANLTDGQRNAIQQHKLDLLAELRLRSLTIAAAEQTRWEQWFVRQDRPRAETAKTHRRRAATSAADDEPATALLAGWREYELPSGQLLLVNAAIESPAGYPLRGRGGFAQHPDWALRWRWWGDEEWQPILRDE